MKMKRVSIKAAISSMVFAGLNIDKEKAEKQIYDIYDQHGYEYQEVFDLFLKQNIGKLDYKILASAIIAYKKEKELRDKILEFHKDFILSLQKNKKGGSKRKKTVKRKKTIKRKTPKQNTLYYFSANWCHFWHL